MCIWILRVGLGGVRGYYLTVLSHKTTNGRALVPSCPAGRSVSACAREDDASALLESATKLWCASTFHACNGIICVGSTAFCGS